MKQLVSTMFTKLSKDGKIALKPSKKNALINFLSCVPEIVTSAAKRDFIIKGFLTPGMMNDKYKRYPNIDTILPTCRRNPSQQEYSLCHSAFAPLLKRFRIEGYIDDSYLQQLGFPIDIDKYRKEARRTATIAQEYI